jgi:hypothetical protein
MSKFSAYLKITFAVLLYILSAFTFIDIMYSLVIPDTVTAVENAFGKLVILIFMLVLAKFTLAAGKKKRREIAAGDDSGGDEGIPSNNGNINEDNAASSELDSNQIEMKKETDK